MAAYATRAPWAFPATYGAFLAGWAYLMTWQNVPQPGTREISMEEWNATPPEYLLHPQLHPTLWGRVPEESAVENKREALFKKHNYPHDHHHGSKAHGHH